MIERFHRQLKDTLRACSTDHNWFHDLPLALLGIRASVKNDIGLSAAELVYGDALRLPADILPVADDYASIADFVKAIRLKIDSQKTAPTRVVPKSRDIPAKLYNAEFVYIRKDSTNTPLGLLKEGPYKVIDRNGDNVIVEKPEGPDAIAWNRTSPAHIDRQVRFNLPRPRGRPRKINR